MKRNRRAGFSLIEVIIVSAIVVFVAATIYMMLWSASNTYGNLNSLGSSQDRARLFMDELAKELRMADGANTFVSTTISAGDTIKFKVPTVDPATGKAILDVSKNPIWSTEITYTAQLDTLIDANNNKLSDEYRLVRIQDGKTHRLSSFVKAGGLVFTKTADNVVIQLTFFNVDHKNKVIETTLRSSVTVRNSST